ncbi:hypothetical protein R1sor_015127 [Riccia sorocarpa]|uniref:Uncharacterized protein n=1 Tax=Riccia sorocarpa TaxID=122646 RepID=A0ABD3HBD6_9MARC
MAPKKRPPQAPPAEAAGAGPSVQPAGPSVPTSRKKKGAKRPRGEPKKPVHPDAIEGEYLVQFEFILDIERHVRWCYVTGDLRRSALRAVRNRELTASGLFAALDLPVHRPHGVSPLDLPMEATMRGRTVRLDAALVRAAFVLPAASMEIKLQVRHSLIVDWFREYERNGKRYIARTCLHREWAPALECICMILLASRRPRCIPGRLVYYIKKFKMDHEDDPEDRLDFVELMVQSLRREVLAVRGHLAGDTPERYMETFVVVPLTWIFIHLGIITGEECDAPPTAPAEMANKKGVEAALKNGFEVLSCLEKSLVVRPGDCLVALLELLQKRCHIIVWSRASLKYVTAFLGLMVSKGYLPAFMLDPQVCTLWGGDGVETVRPRRNLEDSAKLKSFRRLYDHGIYLRDVLLVDTSPERNSLNDPYSAVHPKAVDKFPSAAESSAWLLRFTDWLATWSENLLPTVDFMRSHGDIMDGLTDPLLVLREFWGETPQPIDRAIIWGEVPSGRYIYLTTKWPDFFFHRETVGHPQTVSQESPAEEAPAEGAAPVEEAGHVEEAPVEGAAPVKEPTRVEEAPAEGPARVEEAAPVQEAVHVEEAPVEGAAPVKEPTRVEEAPAEGLTRVEEAPAMGLTHE